MDRHRLVKISKRLAYLLRHRPDAGGLHPDEQGWVSVPDVLAAVGITRAELDAVVAGNDKHRFAVEAGPHGRDRIRASQGHSIPVDLGLAPVEPPEVLYHGTPADNLESIMRDGLRRGHRHHVHLSGDVDTALAVGRRRTRDVVVLVVAAGQMARAGLAFYRSANGVWLTDRVPPAYLTPR